MSKNNSSSFDIMSADIAIQKLDLRSCLERYGMRFNSQGFACCPFHKERTASFSIRGRFWHCFGCGESGELIKFVRKRYGLTYREAVESIAKDFNLKADSIPRVDKKEVKRLCDEAQKATKEYKNLLKQLDIQTDIYWLAYDVREHAIQFYGGESTSNEKYVSAQFALMRAEEKLEQLEYDVREYAKKHPEAVRGLKNNKWNGGDNHK